jgi:DNA polymerase III delta prime subunit
MSTDKFSSNFLWIEKYRVRDINNLVLDESVKAEIKHYLESPKELPNLILIGSAGTGKTTLSRIIVDHVIKDSSNMLIINGSDQRGIETVRKVITEFVSIPPFGDPIKITFIDEADYFTSDAFAAMRHLMEKYSEQNRFILTGNEDNFPEPIKSRSVLIKFKSVSIEYVRSFLKSILVNEKIEHFDQDIDSVIDVYYPDIRSMVSVMQRNSYTGKLDSSNLLNDKTKELDLIDSTLNYIEALRIGSRYYEITNKINDICMKSLVDYREVYKQLFYKVNPKYIPVKVLIYKYTNTLTYALVPGMNYISFIDELKTVIYEMNNLLKNQTKPMEIPEVEYPPIS